MITALAVFFAFLWAFGGFMTAQIAQRIIVPILVSMIGEKRFASPSAFDGCTLGLVGAFTAFVLPAILKAPRSPLQGPAWLVFPLIALGVTVYGLIWLWALGQGAKNREFRIEGSRILNREEQELHPTFLRESSEYYQTDAYNGYSHYFLELHNKKRRLATNAYTSESEFRRDVEKVAALTQSRRLDLIWLYRVEPTKWQYVRFPDSWTGVLCGPLDLLSADDQTWWHAWMLPIFAERIGEQVDIPDARERLKQLRAAYPELRTSADAPDALFKLEERVWADTNFDLDRLLATDGPIEALNDARFQELARETVGKPHVQMLHELDGYAILR